MFIITVITKSVDTAIDANHNHHHIQYPYYNFIQYYNVRCIKFSRNININKSN